MTNIQQRITHYQAGLGVDGVQVYPVSIDEIAPYVTTAPLGERPQREKPKTTIPVPALLWGGALLFLCLTVLNGGRATTTSGPTVQDLQVENAVLKQKIVQYEQQLAQYEGYIMGGQN